MQSVFQKNRKLFLEQIIPFSSKSANYSGLETELDNILLLADRILAAYQEDLEFNRILSIEEQLSDLRTHDKPTRVAEDILKNIELWLRAILSLAQPNIWQLRRRQSHYSLAPLIREDLDLLTQSEISLDLDSFHQIVDPIGSLIFLAYRYRNSLTHSPENYPDLIRARFLPAGLAALIVPVYKYQKEIQITLNGLIISPFMSVKHVNMLSLINSERHKHLINFKGREKWLTLLMQKLTTQSDKSKPYILLNGYEGMGKSALVAKLTEELSGNIQIVGRNAGLVRKSAPWLPNVIIHFGKQSNQPHEIVDLLVSQINTLLLSPIEIDQLRDHSQQGEALAEFSFSSPKPLDVKTYSVSYETYQGDHPEKGYSNVSSKDIDQYKSETLDFVFYRRVLYLALEKVVMERGQIILIIDAVDEISPDGSALQFLPDPLPLGVSALLSARHDIRVIDWLSNNRDVEKIRISEIEKHEVPLFTNIHDDDGETQARFNERVWRISRGWPMLVVEAGKLARENPENLDEIQIANSRDNLFERQVNNWRLNSAIYQSDPLREILILLSIFEPVCSIDLDIIQAYLERNGSKFSRDEIKQILHKVSSQIEGLDANSLKLALKAFADYIRDRWLGKRDLLRVLADIVTWLANEVHETTILARFINYWSSSVHSKDVREITEKLITEFSSRDEAETLYKIYLDLRKQSKQTLVLSTVTLSCLTASADLGNSKAMSTLGGRLLDGAGVAKDINGGKIWLEKAAESGNIHAMLSLGNRLIDGKGITQDVEKGSAWLTKALEKGDEQAKYIYANRLLDGQGISPEPLEGEKMLRDLADHGYEPARLTFATRMIKGDGIEQDIETGEKILRDLAVTNNTAAISLAKRLIDGEFVTANPEEGEEILRKLEKKGDKEAILFLANRLHYGRGLTQNTSESLKLLTNLANAGDTDVMQILGDILIDGDQVPSDSTEGMKWLVRASEADDFTCMTKLAVRLLDGKGVKISQVDGKKWLYKAAEAQYPVAMQILGSRLLDGIGLPKDVKAGNKWLSKASESNDNRALTILGHKLLHGDGVPKDIFRGEQYLRRAVDSEYADAMRILGVELLKGEKLHQNLRDGEKFLRLSAEKGNIKAMTLLSMYLIDGQYLEPNLSEGFVWLNKAVDNGGNDAKTYLGARLIEGFKLEQDLVRGEELMRDVVSTGDAQAKRVLGELIIEGKIPDQKKEEGCQLIKDAAEAGDKQAIFYFSQLLINGIHLPRNQKEGKKWLKKLVQLDDMNGILDLGRRYLFGDDLEKDVKEGRNLLLRALKRGQGTAGAYLGRYYYQNRNLDMATFYMMQGVELGDDLAKNNFSFMIRRGEVTNYPGTPTLKELLLDLVNQKELYALINYALCFAKGVQCQIDWHKADEIFSSLVEADSPPKRALLWWHEFLVTKNNDAEGHLVIGWLARHKFIEDPDNLTVEQRLAKAREGGWDVPNWMNIVV